MSRKPLKTPETDLRSFEEDARRRGFHLIAGVDEAGRGPLAGPVVAAAVVLPHDVELPGVNDSKLLTPARRELRCLEIFSCALGVGVACVDVDEIARINILQASLKAMVLAVEDLPQSPHYILIDGPYRIDADIPQEGIPRGDKRSLSIAAASIVAKVHRDRLMREYHNMYPQYGFNRHKGYGTAEHLAALRLHGPCPIHRLTFRGVLSPAKGNDADDGETT